ncbi:urease accessory protein UreD [Paractinoplanes rishiriensis]|uniref:Urease accessory protein UreD n=1 Tax=Paractinoplanes rishiriensis TaxID=1050105 RepID=A0A919MRK3_9ACTN|nr:urease accessory protein UreD [Actinoplanes rishiriensis]GIE92678.1 urease accessory protein UreD [Actinoplanes rishiriensis]
MRAVARIVAERAPHGGTRLSVLHGESPLLLRRTGPPTRAGVTVHLVGGAAGPLRGDDLRVEIQVGPDAVLTVRSVAAQLALPGRPGLPPSRLEIRATVAAGATLSWLPEPLIAAAGCDHHTVTHVEAADGATLLWREDLVCGRHAEEPGDVRTTTTIRYAGRTLYRHDLAVGPATPGWDGAAVLGRGRAIGTLVAAPALPNEPPSTPVAAMMPPPTPVAAVMPLSGPGVLATAVGADIREVGAALDPLCVR